jgi:hypothetical protein
VAGAPILQKETCEPVRKARQGKYPLIAVVGPCASGKSLLVDTLRARGYNVREVAQEHSYVPAMWQRFTQPDLLVYLDVSWVVARRRRPTNAGARRWDEQAHRLRHARQHAHLYIHTDELTPGQISNRVLAFLKETLTQSANPVDPRS